MRALFELVAEALRDFGGLLLVFVAWSPPICTLGPSIDDRDRPPEMEGAQLGHFAARPFA